jgi:hypothetical protein
VNLTPLSGPNISLFWKLWEWLKLHSGTTREPPKVTSDSGNYHDEGLIGIDESSGDANYPLGGIMLEELLHYITTTTNPESSADYSPEFLRSIDCIIFRALATRERDQKRAFQSMLIRYLWELIESENHAGRQVGQIIAAPERPGETSDGDNLRDRRR